MTEGSEDLCDVGILCASRILTGDSYGSSFYPGFEHTVLVQTCARLTLGQFEESCVN